MALDEGLQSQPLCFRTGLRDLIFPTSAFSDHSALCVLRAFVVTSGLPIENVLARVKTTFSTSFSLRRIGFDTEPDVARREGPSVIALPGA